jgi:hypothetical protein
MLFWFYHYKFHFMVSRWICTTCSHDIFFGWLMPRHSVLFQKRMFLNKDVSNIVLTQCHYTFVQVSSLLLTLIFKILGVGDQLQQHWHQRAAPAQQFKQFSSCFWNFIKSSMRGPELTFQSRCFMKESSILRTHGTSDWHSFRSSLNNCRCATSNFTYDDFSQTHDLKGPESAVPCTVSNTMPQSLVSAVKSTFSNSVINPSFWTLSTVLFLFNKCPETQ